MVHKVSPPVPMQQQHMIQQPKNNMGCEVTRQTRAVRTMISESYLLTGSTPVTPPLKFERSNFIPVISAS